MYFIKWNNLTFMDREILLKKLLKHKLLFLDGYIKVKTKLYLEIKVYKEQCDLLLLNSHLHY